MFKVPVYTEILKRLTHTFRTIIRYSNFFRNAKFRKNSLYAIQTVDDLLTGIKLIKIVSSVVNNYHIVF